jgi:hypothetical protein
MGGALLEASAAHYVLAGHSGQPDPRPGTICRVIRGPGPCPSPGRSSISPPAAPRTAAPPPWRFPGTGKRFLAAHRDDPALAAQWLAVVGAVLNPAVADHGDSGSRPISPTPALLAAARQNSGLPARLGILPPLRVRSHPSRVRRRIADVQNGMLCAPRRPPTRVAVTSRKVALCNDHCSQRSLASVRASPRVSVDDRFSYSLAPSWCRWWRTMASWSACWWRTWQSDCHGRVVSFVLRRGKTCPAPTGSSTACGRRSLSMNRPESGGQIDLAAVGERCRQRRHRRTSPRRLG